MKKLLGLLLCLGFVVALSVSTTGCKKEKSAEEKKKEADKKAVDDKAVADKKAVDDKAAADKIALDKKADEDKKAKADADKKVKDDADKKVKDDADKKVKDDADKKVKDDADKKVKDAADKKAKDAADKKVMDDDAKAAAALKTALAAVKLKDITAVVDVAKKGGTKVKVELADAAPADLTLNAWADKVDAKVLTGTGTIKKGDKSAEVTITTVDAPASVTAVTIDLMNGKDKVASTKIKTAVK